MKLLYEVTENGLRILGPVTRRELVKGVLFADMQEAVLLSACAWDAKDGLAELVGGYVRRANAKSIEVPDEMYSGTFQPLVEKIAAYHRLGQTCPEGYDHPFLETFRSDIRELERALVTYMSNENDRIKRYWLENTNAGKADKSSRTI